MKSDKVPVPSQVRERVLPEARCDDTAVPRVPDSSHTAPPSSPPCSQRGPCTRCPGHSRLLPSGHWHPVLHPRRRAVAGVVTAETGQVSAAAGGIWRRQPTSQLTAGLQSLHGGWSRHAQGQSWAEGVGWLRPSPAHPRWPCFVSPAPSRLHPPPDTQSPGLAPCTPTRGSVTPCSVAAGPAALSQQGARRRLPRTGPRTTWGPLCKRESD